MRARHDIAASLVAAQKDHADALQMAEVAAQRIHMLSHELAAATLKEHGIDTRATGFGTITVTVRVRAP